MDNDTFTIDGKTYEMIDGNIVDSRTNILVCTDVANQICSAFGIMVKQEVNSRENIDVAFLNSKIKNRKLASA